jgi:hypothetical protein
MRLSKQQRGHFVERKIVESLIAGKGINETARPLKRGKEKIGAIRKLPEEAGYLSGATPLPPFPEDLSAPRVEKRTTKTSDVDQLLSQHAAWIKERLDGGWHAITVFEELPVKVQRSSFCRFLERHGLSDEARRPRRVVPEIVHESGEALLIDWGKVASVVDPVTGKSRTVWAFVCTLGYSRYMMVRFVMSQDVATTLGALESMLHPGRCLDCRGDASTHPEWEVWPSAPSGAVLFR